MRCGCDDCVAIEKNVYRRTIFNNRSWQYLEKQGNCNLCPVLTLLRSPVNRVNVRKNGAGESVGSLHHSQFRSMRRCGMGRAKSERRRCVPPTPVDGFRFRVTHRTYVAQNDFKPEFARLDQEPPRDGLRWSKFLAGWIAATRAMALFEAFIPGRPLSQASRIVAMAPCIARLAPSLLPQKLKLGFDAAPVAGLVFAACCRNA